jgi:hypothetical protein
LDAERIMAGPPMSTFSTQLSDMKRTQESVRVHESESPSNQRREKVGKRGLIAHVSKSAPLATVASKG